MLSTQYRLRLEFICKCIVNGEDVKLDDMIWADKLAKSNGSAGEMLRKARRKARNPDMKEGGLDDFLNQMDLGNPDPSNHKTNFVLPDWYLIFGEFVTQKNIKIRYVYRHFAKSNKNIEKKHTYSIPRN